MQIEDMCTVARHTNHAGSLNGLKIIMGSSLQEEMARELEGGVMDNGMGTDKLDSFGCTHPLPRN